MTDTDNDRSRQRAEIDAALERNRKRRNRARYETDEAREELAELLARGLSLPWPFKIAEMARTADISRETAHKLLRRRSDG
jgi:DNA invertase Pin-like site-specific DNA recombinase